MTTNALKKTTTKADGGLYTNAIHKVTAAKVAVTAEGVQLSVRLSMFKDQATADACEPSAYDRNFNIDTTDPSVAVAIAALQDAIYESVMLQDEHLSDAEEIKSAD